MNQPSNRATQERFAAAIAEKRRRQAKKLMAQRGYRDEETGEWVGGLLSFIRYYWHILEPGTVFRDGWALEAICEHLEAVTFGEIDRLLVNVPPGFMKSLVTDVFWPAWEWGPMDMAHIRYVAFSYSASITERDNDKFGILIGSPEYQGMWGDRVKLRKRGQGEVSNTKHGRKLASSVGGVGTGERGDRIICFPYDQLVATEFGHVEIGKFVESKCQDRVWSYNRKTRQFELQEVTGWHKNEPRQLLRVTMSDGRSVECTFDHRILTEGGYRSAADLFIGQKLLTAPRWMGVAPSSVIAPQVQTEMLPYSAISNPSHGCGTNTKLNGKNLGGVVVSCSNLAHQFFRQMCSAVAESTIALCVRNVLRSRAVLKIGEVSVRSVVVLMTNLLPGWAWTKKRVGHQLMAESVNGLSAASQGDARITFIQNWREQTARNFHQVPTSDGGSWKAPNVPVGGNFVNTLQSHDGQPQLVTVSNVENLHDLPSATYCITVSSNHNMVIGKNGANIICANCDDPHSVKDSESQTILPETVRWFREAMSNRLNDMKNGAIVIIMQRVHEADVSGTILEEGMDYVHLMIPMEFDWDRVTDPDTGEAIPNAYGWIDPRWQPERDDCDGELAWPERFDEKEVVRLKRDMGPHSWFGQYQQTPKGRGTSIISREYWQLWDDNDGKFPPFEYIVASLDSAYTKDKQNDPSGFTIWGVFRNERGHRRIMLIHAWRKRLILHGIKVEKKPGEHPQMYRKRAMPHWGLVEWVADTCTRFQADKLLIEAKASGIDVANEMRRLHAREGWDIELVPVSQDKVSRAVAVQPTWSQGMIYAPDRQWAQDVIDEMDVFPKGKFDDLTDSATQGIKHLRAIGMANSDEETYAEERENVKPKKKLGPLYPTMKS